MKILVLAPGLPLGDSHSGMQIIYQRVARLIDRGHRVGLACFFDPVSDRPQLDQLHTGLVEAELVSNPMLQRIAPSLFTMGRLSTPSSFFRLASPKMARRIGEMVARSNYDVVMSEFTAMGQYLHRNPWLPAVRKVISCHESPTLSSLKMMKVMDNAFSWAHQWLEYRHMRHLEFTLYNTVDRVLTLTNEDRMSLQEEDPRVRITTVPAGLRSDYFRPMPEIPKEHCVTLTGRFGSDQTHFGAMWFLRTVWPILQKADPKLCLYLVGRNPQPALSHAANRLQRVHVTGEVDDLRPYLAKSKVFACPILSGSGLRGKILEAMSMELPVVCTSIAAEGIPVRMGQNALFADTAAIMANSILHLVNDERKAKIMGRAAREMVLEEFYWPTSMDRLEAVFRDVTSKRSYHLVA